MRSLCLAICLFLLAPAHAAKQETSALVNFANDYAKVLKPAELNALETQLAEINRWNRYQFAVAIHPQLPAGAERDNATELADKLLVGSAVDNRGLVIFVFVAEKVVRIEVGYGLEGLIPDALAHRIADGIAQRIAKGEMAAALSDAIAELERPLESLKRVEQKSTSWNWLPDFVLATMDAARGMTFYVKHHREFPKQLASWWRSNDDESRAVTLAFGALGALFLLFCLRPVLGALLLIALPSASIPRQFMYWTFFKGTNSAGKAMLEPGGTKTIEKSGGVFDALYYSFGFFLVVGCALTLFILFVGQPGGFDGAGAWARW